MAIDGESSIDLWHKRMGHHSENVLRALPCVSSTNHSCNKYSCEICLRSHQPRSSFPLSTSRANIIFELVHLDLWSPYKTRSTCGASYF